MLRTSSASRTSSCGPLESAPLPPSTAGWLGGVRRHPIASLLGLTFGLTWLLEIPRVLDARGQLPLPFPFPLLILMGWMPGLAAITVAAASGGRPAVAALFRRLLIWRVGWRWYALVVGGTAVIWLSALALNPLFGGTGLQLPDLSTDVVLGLVINFVLLFLVNSEELVWRGSLLPRLQARSNALVASVIIGTAEGLFHLPLFFQPDSDQAAAGLPVFVIGSIAGALIFTWLFNSTSGSLLLVQLFHIVANTWITLFAATPADNVITQWLFNAILVLVAAIGLVIASTRRPPSRNDCLGATERSTSRYADVTVG